jgi:hypothetical protein
MENALSITASVIVTTMVMGCDKGIIDAKDKAAAGPKNPIAVQIFLARQVVSRRRTRTKSMACAETSSAVALAAYGRAMGQKESGAENEPHDPFPLDPKCTNVARYFGSQVKRV